MLVKTWSARKGFERREELRIPCPKIRERAVSCGIGPPCTGSVSASRAVLCEGTGHTAEEQTSQGCIEVCGAKIEAGNDETEERRNEIYMNPSDLA